MQEKVLKGTTGSLGKYKGKVKVVISFEDFKKFDKGNVLVAEATNPAYTPLIAAAGAVVTDRGGTLSHAAIVSREYGIPAIVGTKDATKVLKDGDLVEVDAEKGIVRKLTDG